MRKNKILFGITLSEMGGAQKVVFDIISSLDEEEYDITLVTSPGGELLEWIDDINHDRKSKINMIILPYLKRNILTIQDLIVFLKLYWILKKGNYDVAHFHSSKMGILGRLAAWLARVPKIVFTVHGWGINDYQSSFKQKLLGCIEKLVGKINAKVICVSSYDKKKGIEKGWIKDENTCVIHNGIDPAPSIYGKLFNLVNVSEDVLILGTIARLQEQKNPFFTIKVFQEIKKMGYNAKLVIIGDGTLKKDCISYVHSLGIDSEVFFLGTCSNAREILNDFSIFTLFSRWEGLPLTIIEAMLAGKPVVASDVGGIPELIDHKGNGFIIKDFNISRGVMYIKRLLDDKELRFSMGLVGREKAIECFSKKKMVESYIDIYLEK